MTEQNQSENLRYEQDPKGPIGQFFAPFAGYGVILLLPPDRYRAVPLRGALR